MPLGPGPQGPGGRGTGWYFFFAILTCNLRCLRAAGERFAQFTLACCAIGLREALVTLRQVAEAKTTSEGVELFVELLPWQIADNAGCQRPAMITRLRNTQTKKIGHYIHFAGNVLLWGKSSIRIEIHF